MAKSLNLSSSNILVVKHDPDPNHDPDLNRYIIQGKKKKMQEPEVCPVFGSKFKCEMSEGDKTLCQGEFKRCPAYSAWYYYKGFKELSKEAGKWFGDKLFKLWITGGKSLQP